MSAMTFFYKECPVCGRSLRIAVKYFGRQMSCTHCGGEFHAGSDDKDSSRPASEDAASNRGFIAHARCGAAQLGEV